MDDIDYSEPFAVINGGEGYYVQGTVTEDLLDTFVPGMEISCNSWVNAVSYTHLDVYKRQIRHSGFVLNC